MLVLAAFQQSSSSPGTVCIPWILRRNVAADSTVKKGTTRTELALERPGLVIRGLGSDGGSVERGENTRRSRRWGLDRRRRFADLEARTAGATRSWILRR
jgi:hypothetical protein